MNATDITPALTRMIYLCSLLLALVALQARADVPTAQLITAPLMDPSSGSAAWQYYGTTTTHTKGLAAWSSLPPEIKALGRTLGSDRLLQGASAPITQDQYVQNVFNYIHSNIDVEYRFGLGKGGRGALIDQYGTPFDQAELMVELLRAPSTPIAASYVVGTATLTARQFGLWTGLVNNLDPANQTFSVDAQSACQFMADGGIPASCSPASGSLSAITIMHIWVSVNGKVYDPSYKEYKLQLGINLPAAMGCDANGTSTCGQAVVDSGMAGTTSSNLNGIPYVQGFRFYDWQKNSATAQSGGPTAQSTAFGEAVSLANTIMTGGSILPGGGVTTRQWQVQDVVGGKTLSPFAVMSFAGLPYTASPQLTWSGDIPDQFRTTLTVTTPGVCVNTLFFADEIANRRLNFTGGNNQTDQLYLDGIPVTCPTNITAPPTAPYPIVTLAVNHPYAANQGTYGDDTTTFNLVEDPSFETGVYGCSGGFIPLSGVSGYLGSGTNPATKDENPAICVNEPETSIGGSMPLTIVHEFGDQATSASHFMSDLVMASPVMVFRGDCRPNTSTPTLSRTCGEDSQSTGAETIGPYRTLMGKIVSGVTGVALTRHHDVGVIFSSRYPNISRVTMHEAESIDSPVGDTTVQKRAFEIESAVLTTVEAAGAAADPNSDGDFADSFLAHIAPTTRIFDVAPDMMNTLLGALPGSYPTWRQTQLQNAANAGYETIIPDGGSAEMFLGSVTRAYTTWENLKGASAPSDPFGGAMRTTDVVDTASKRRKDFSVSEADGSLTFQAPPDIITGAGDFPASLPFVRTYKSTQTEIVIPEGFLYMNFTGSSEGAITLGGGVQATQHNGWDNDAHARLGGGWTHNYNITAQATSDAAKGLGEDFAAEATTAIAGVVILNDLLSGTPSLPNRLATVATLDEISYGLYGNTFIVKKGASSEALFWLPTVTKPLPFLSSSYQVPPQVYMLKYNGSPAVETYLSSNGSSAQVTCNVSPGPETVTSDNGSQIGHNVGGSCTYQGAAGDVITFYPSFSPNSDILSGSVVPGQPPEPKIIGNSNVYAATSWVFPNGIRLDFSYKNVTVANKSTEFSGCNQTAAALTGYCILADTGWVLTKVQNNLGRSLTFNTTPYTDPNLFTNAWLINSVSDENGRSATFSVGTCPIPFLGSSFVATTCDAFTATDPNGNTTRYEYFPDTNSPDPAIIEKPNFRLRRWFTPGGGSTPYAIFDYDELYRIQSIKTLVSGSQYRTTQYYPGAIAGTERRKVAYDVSPSGFTTETVFDQHNNPIWEQDPMGLITTHTYDNANRLLTTTYPEGNGIAKTYDIRGNMLTETEIPKPGSVWAQMSPITTTSTYSEGPTVFACVNPVTCNEEVSEQDPKGNVSSYTWDSTTGNLKQILLPADNDGNRPETDFGYAAYINSTTDPTNTPFYLLTSKQEKVTATPSVSWRVTSYAYNASNKYVLHTVSVDPGNLNLTTTLTFDGVGNLQTVDGPLPGTADTTTYHFDADRQITRIDAPDNSTTRYTYDVDGDLLTTNRALVPLASITDSNPSNPMPTDLIGGQWQTTTQVFNVGGDLLSVTDAEGNQTQFGYDGDGRKVLVTDPDSRQVATVLDGDGRTSCIWRGGTVATTNWTPTYVQTTEPVSGQFANSLGCGWTPSNYIGNGAFRYAEYSYTGNSKQQTVTDADGNTTAYYYDGLDRAQFTMFPDPNAASQICTVPTSPSNNYDSDSTIPACPAATVAGQPGATFEQYTYDPNDNRKSVRTRGGDTIAYTYDALNRQWTKSPDEQGTVTTTYNLINLPLTVSKAAYGNWPAHTTSYGYDTAVRKTSETNDSRMVSYQYDNDGKRTRTTWPEDYFVQYYYDDLNRMTDAKENDITELAHYDYDPLSRRNFLCLGGGSDSSCPDRTNYAYEDDSDLKTLTQALNATTVSLGYGHNHSHQITSINANDSFYLPRPASSFSTAYVPNALNQYSSVDGQSSTYDANGNLLTWYPSDGKATYTYDSENRLTSAAVKGSNTPTNYYDYDALGRRAGKMVNGVVTHYLLDGDEEIAEYDGSGNLLRRYVTGPAVDDRIMHQEINGSTITETFYHTNHQGSVIDMTDAGGNVTQRLAYDEYGKLTTPNTGEMFRYTGRRFDPETGLYYYRARYYSPDLGRFLQTDPIGYKDDLDLYAYTGNDPLDKNDPSGDCPWCIDFVVGAALEATTEYVTTGHVDVGEVIKQGAISAINPLAILGKAASVARAVAAVAKAEHTIAEVEQTVVNVDSAVTKIAASAEKKTGSYTIEFKNGKKYHGKGPESRMEQSAREKAADNGGVANKDWKESANDREAFKAEHERIKADGGVKNENNLNRRNSPGKKFCEQDRNCTPE